MFFIEFRLKTDITKSWKGDIINSYIAYISCTYSDHRISSIQMHRQFILNDKKYQMAPLI